MKMASESQGIERAVETNQRHLIKKILARYPSQWTFFRELVQNADDACAKTVVIEFETDKETKNVSRTIVSNDGLLFSDEDWGRLTSIASGNPAVDKIGFFGVGFYCVFSLSDAPCVSSGKKRLDFFWKGNALYTRETVQEQADNWTRFYLPVLNIVDSSPPPEFEDIGGFLAELLCFTRHITTVKVLCDGVPQVSATRKDDFSLPLSFPPGLTHEGDESLIGIFNRNLTRTAPVKFLAKKNGSAVSRTKLTMTRYRPNNSTEESSISFVRGQASFHTQLSEFSARAYFDMTQKSHPNTIQISILTTLERKSTKSSETKPAEMFLYNKLSPMGGKGRVFIGFITSQTIGSIHVGGPFVPTMERENLDFATPIAKDWNLNLFYTVGTLARVLHEHISSNPATFFTPSPQDLLQTSVASNNNNLPKDKPQSKSSFFLVDAIKKASSMFTAFASDASIFSAVDEEKEDDDALFSSLEENSGAIVVTSMANFSPMFSECRPYPGVGPQVWKGFVAKDFEHGPRVWTTEGRSVSCDKTRVFPSPDADLPQLSSIETFPVIPIQISRPRPVGYKNIGGLASVFVEKLKEDKLLYAFDLNDILSELQKRPLRGIQETLAFVEWYFRPAPVQFVTVRCGNCGAHSRIKSNTTTFNCASCRYPLVYQKPREDPIFSLGNGPGNRESHLKTSLLNSARCILEDGSEFKLSKWRFKLDPKLELYLPLIKETLPKDIVEQICPLEITKKSSVDLQLDLLTLETWVFEYFTSLSSRKEESPSISDSVWKVLLAVAKLGDKNMISRISTMACIPTTKAGLQTPKLVYTSELEGQHEEVFVLAPIPSWVEKEFKSFTRKFLIQQLGIRESVSPLIVVNSFLKGRISQEELWDTISNLVVTNRENLEPEVIDLLTKSKCLPKVVKSADGSALEASSECYVPSSLYTSAPALLDLDDEMIPLAYVKDTHLTDFLQKKLKLQTSVAPDVYLKIAANETRTKEKRVKALMLFVNALLATDQYFDFLSISQPIIPCTDATWSSPRNCFLEVPSILEPLKLKVCSLDNPVLTKRLGIVALPPPSLSIDLLHQRASNDSLDEKMIYDILDCLATRQLNEMTEKDCLRLSQMAIIPIPRGCMLCSDSVKFAQPRSCFFELTDETDDDLKTLFCFIPRTAWMKTPKHKTFFQSIGVRDAPSLSELAEQLAMSPTESLSRLGYENYLNLLRSIASDFAKIKPQTRTSMQRSACLLAKSSTTPTTSPQQNLESHVKDSNATTSSESSTSDDIWKLYVPADIIVEDDSRYRRLFSQVPSCPCEPSLEHMYMNLGSSLISRVVSETSFVQMETAKYTKEASIMEKRLCERIPVLIQKVPVAEWNRERVKYWNEAAKKKRRESKYATAEDALVLEVPEIRCEMKLALNRKITVKNISSTACVSKGRLYVTKQIDFFHIASALVAEFSSVRSNDRALLWATLLQSSAQSLEEMGFVLPKDTVIPPTPNKRLLEESESVVASVPPAKHAPQSSPDVRPQGESSEALKPSTPPNNDAEPSKPPPIPSTVPQPPVIPKAVEPSSLPPPTQLPSSTKLPSMKLPSLSPGNLPFSSSKSRPETPQPLSGRPMGGGTRIALDQNKARDTALSTALSKCRPSETTQGRIFSPASQTAITEPMMDCTEQHDLVRDDGIGVIECFIQRGSVTPSPFKTNVEKAREFSNLLVQLSIEVFGIDCSSVHMYWDERLTSRAFNRAGSLFFNLVCWVNDHDSIKSSATWKRWFGTMAHELAHNLWSAHDAQFANYLELICVEFSDKLLMSLKLRGLD